MAATVLASNWRCDYKVEVVTVPGGIGVGGWCVVVVRGEVEEWKGGYIEEVRAVWSTLWNSCCWCEGWADVGVNFDSDGSIFEEAAQDFNK